MLQGSAEEAVDEAAASKAQEAGAAASNTPDAPSSEVPSETGKRIAFMFAALCLLIALAAPATLFKVDQLALIWPPGRAWIDWGLQLHWLLGLLVVAPFAIMAFVILDLRAIRAGRKFGLVRRSASNAGAFASQAVCGRGPHEDDCSVIKASWHYEKERIGQLQCRLVLQGLLFGDLTTFALMCCALVAGAGDPADKQMACSVAAAAATGFLTGLARILLRISGGDITTRTLSWAIRSQLLVIIADVGLYVLLANEVQTAQRALLLGVFVGATGHHAIQFMIEKASKVFNTGTAGAQRASPLLEIEGVTDDHVERLAEEGIASIHDLAFVPTPRLFMATTYSLAQICNWQDRALLRVRVGKAAADALAQTMMIHGAYDLMVLAHDLASGGGSDADDRTTVLAAALKVEPKALTAALPAMAHDENAIRVHTYASSTVAVIEDPRPAAERNDRHVSKTRPTIFSLSRLVPSRRSATGSASSPVNGPAK